MKSRALKIIQLSDLHLFANKAEKLDGIAPQITLEAVITKIYNDVDIQPLDLVVITGDISQDYSAASYEVAWQLCAKLHVPIVAVPGNHDAIELFKNIFTNPQYSVTEKSLLQGNWLLVFLSSNFSGEQKGHIVQQDLLWLNAIMQQTIAENCIIFLHHHVLPVQSPGIDNLSLENAEEFLAVISKAANKFKKVLVVSGHVHQEYSQTISNIIFLTTPSTCWQFKPSSLVLQLDNLMPGFRYICLYEDSNYMSKIVRVDYNAQFVPKLS
jgi:3',5'-cyclic-AMP phosphodiesterase